MFPVKIRDNSRRSLVSIILMTNAFVWYFFVINILKDIVETTKPDYLTTLLIWSVHFAGIVASAIVAATLASRLKGRTRFLTIWMIFGIVASAASVVVDKTSVLNVVILSLFLGVSLGMGMPSCMGYFTESIGIGKRGRVGGLILLLSGAGMFALGTAAGKAIDSQTLVLAGWRLSGLLLFLLFERENEKNEKSKIVTYRSLFNRRPFILYLIPWIMFSLITYLTIPIQSTLVGKSAVDSMMVIESVLGGIFSLIGGFLSDVWGRKRVAIMGFATLGLGYSVLGIYPKELLSWYFYTVIDGVAWGMLYVVFVVTLWGDLSNDSKSDKFYAIGVSPFFISKFLQLTIGSEIAGAIAEEAIFSFTAFFLFLAVLPLVYAPETLPEKVMKDRDLKSYAQKALEKAQKEEKKKNKNAEEKEEETGSEESPEDEETRKLAEKYY
jgi:MFS family permease